MYLIRKWQEIKDQIPQYNGQAVYDINQIRSLGNYYDEYCAVTMSYSNISIEGTIKVMDGVANVDFVIDALTISGKNPFIKPGQSHESAINNIRQDERIYA